MVIKQNVVVWNKKNIKNTGAGISLCRKFRSHSENFAKLAKFSRDSENKKFRYEL